MNSDDLFRLEMAQKPVKNRLGEILMMGMNPIKEEDLCPECFNKLEDSAIADGEDDVIKVRTCVKCGFEKEDNS